MATTINSYSVSLGMDARGYVNGANLSRQETKALVKDIESARTPSEKLAVEQDRLQKALESGAISQGTYNRLLESKRNQLGLTTTAMNPYALALGAIAVAGAAAIAGGVAFVAHLRDVQGNIDETAKAATKLGMSFNEVSSIRFAAAEIGGMDAGAVDTAMKKMQINAAKALEGDETLQRAFASIGVDAATVLDQGPLEAVKRIADGFGGVTSQAERLKLAAELFGKGGADMVDTLQAGRGAIEESANYQEKWNALTDAQVVGVEANNDAWGRVFHMVDGISTKLAADFAPAMQLVADYILDSTDGVTGIDDGIRMAVDTTVYLAGLFKDVFELTTVIHTTLGNIASLNFTGAVAGINDALDFSSGDKALQALYDKRFALEQAASEKQKQRDLERQKLQLEDIDEIDAAKKRADEEAKRTLEEQDRKRTQMATNAIKEAESLVKKQQADQAKIRADVSAGPGAGMEAGSAEAARFMADQVNAQIGAAAAPELPTPGEAQILAEAQKQVAIAEAAEKKQQEQIDALKKLVEASEKNGFSRIR